MAEGPSRKQSATISFTLPISCQICLGKVKQPIVCPNQHVFCTPCMDLWLQHNEQCPTCRTPITADNPCRPIIGAGSQCDGSLGSMSTAAMRKARFDVLYQDYEMTGNFSNVVQTKTVQMKLHEAEENEIQKLEAQIDLLHSQNKAFRKQLDEQAGRDCDQSSRKESSPRSKAGKKDCEFNALMSLTKKLQEATRAFEGIKSNLEQKNAKLEQDVENLRLENQKLRQELAERSPQKYGRFTVAAQQSKLDQYEREIKQLKRALKTNDDYVDQLEVELARYKRFELMCNRGKSCGGGDGGNGSVQNADVAAAGLSSARDRNSSASSGVSSLSTENSRFDLSELVDVSQSEDSRLKDNTHAFRKQDAQTSDERRNAPKYPRAADEDLPRDSFDADNSLNLELPTPITPASCLSRLSLDQSSSGKAAAASTPQDQSFLSSDASGSANSRGSSRRRLNFGADSKPRLGEGNSGGQGPPPRYSHPPGLSQKPFSAVSDSSFHLEQPNDVTVSSDLDVTVTSDFEDCARLMLEATQRVEQRRLESSDSDQSSSFKPSGSLDLPSSSDLYPGQNTDATLAGSTSLSMTQLQATATWPNRPGSAPGMALDSNSIHANHGPSSSFPDMRRPSSAPNAAADVLQNQLSYQSNFCNSVSLDLASSSVWKPLSSCYPGTSKVGQAQPSVNTSATAFRDHHGEVGSCPSVQRQPWPPSLKSRLYGGGLSQPATTTTTNSTPGLDFSHISAASQPSLLGTLNQARQAGLSLSSAGYARPVGRVTQYPPTINSTSVVPQPLRAMHQLQEMHAMRAMPVHNGGGIDSDLDNRKRKPELPLYHSTNNSQHEPPGNCSPPKTFKLF